MEEVKQELSKRIQDIEKRTARIRRELDQLSAAALILNDYFEMVRRVPAHELAQAADISPRKLHSLARACRLTANAPEVNRSLCKRFDILP